MHLQEAQSTTRSLAPERLEQYRADGYCHPIEALTENETRSYLERLDAYEKATGAPIDATYRHKPHLLFPWLHDIVCHPRVLDAIEDVLGPNILCWGSGFFIKEARDPAYVSWHQDSTYWGLSRPDVVTAWIAFTPSTRENGCMRVVPGSHRDQIAHKDTFHEHNLLSRGQEIEVSVDEADAVDIELEPGQMSLHHVRIIHGSNPNRSAGRRVGYAIRYIPTDVRQLNGPQDFATLVRGVDEHGYYELEPRPASVLDEKALKFHARVCEAQGQILYAGADVQPFRGR
jgi:ectoine hydroxylase-related dioxygenase (phytanoyl-CoA dioxygenase family)